MLHLNTHFIYENNMNSFQNCEPNKYVAKDVGLDKSPNMFAPRSDIIFENNERFHVYGYQEFLFNPVSYELHPINDNLVKKYSIIQNYFTNKWLSKRSVLDLGGNNGFFSFAAVNNGALNATVVDMDEKAIHNIKTIIEKSSISVNGLNEQVQNWNEPKDIVLAFALVHWIFNLTEGNSSLEETIKKLSTLSKDALFIEWVDITDPLILQYDHVSANIESNRLNYNEELFVKYLKNEFKDVKLLGSLSPTRRIYLANRESFYHDLSWEEPLLFPKDTIISSKKLIEINNQKLWSRVYRVENKIYKQASKLIGDQELSLLKKN